MTFVACLVRLVARSLGSVAVQLGRTANALNGLLPALLPPAQLNALTRNHYQKHLSRAPVRMNFELEPHDLQAWEDDMLTRYAAKPGLLLVMGCGFGREAIAIARRGFSVVGIDWNAAAVRAATAVATAEDLPARFHLADYVKLPYAEAVFDYALLSATMYSVIPGMEQRQAWLKDLRRVLKPDGFVLLSFISIPLGRQPSRLGAIRRRFTRLLARVPGANRSYQDGDECPQDHFFHFFRDEAELRQEMEGAGAVIRELNLNRNFAVLAYPPPGEPPVNEHDRH